MDHIHKFIAKRPGKNHRIIEYKNESYTITKPDMHALHRYKHNHCLTDLDLYAPLTTKWSSILQQIPLKTTRKKVASLQQKFKKFREKIMNLKFNEYKNVNEIVNLWKNEKLDDFEYKIEFNKIVDEGIEGSFLNLRSNKDNILSVLKKVEDEYFAIEKKKIKFETMLINGTVCEDEMYIGKYYVFEKRILDFSIYKDEIAVLYEDALQVYEFRNKRLIFSHNVEFKASKIQLTDNIVIIAYKNNIKIIKRTDISLDNFVFSEVGSVSNKKDKDSLTITCKDKIVDFAYSDGMFAFTSNRNVYLTNTETQKSKILKFKTENILNLKIDKLLYISTTNGFYIYNVNENKYQKRITGLFSYIHSFSVNDNFSVICDRNSRITIYTQGVEKVLEQSSFIKSIELHNEKNCFLVQFEDIVQVFDVSKEDKYQCSIIGKINGEFRKVKYDREKSWVYAVRKNKLFLYV